MGFCKKLAAFAAAASIGIGIYGCDPEPKKETPVIEDRPAYHISEEDSRRLDEIVESYKEIRDIGRFTDSKRDDIDKDHQHIITLLSEVYPKNDVIETYNKMREFARQKPITKPIFCSNIVYYHFPIILLSSLEHGFDKTMGMYSKVRTKGRDTLELSDDIALKDWDMITKITLDLIADGEDVEKAYYRVCKVYHNFEKAKFSNDLGITEDDYSLLIRTVLEFGFNDTIGMYERVREVGEDTTDDWSDNVYHFDRLPVMNLALRHNDLDNVLTDYFLIRRVGKDTASYSDNILFLGDTGLLLNLTSEIDVERLIRIYDKAKTIGSDT
ncbi:MAG: hypothetical protein KKA79_05300, partial [Nanoarchaeota archaeon]|nr:hypothetical protein [Nanoarchaeota archaeon]